MPSRDEVRRTFDRIAGHFSQTREYPWPEVEAFVADAELDGDVDVVTALDLGCGNGRHAELLADRAARVVCLDASRGLLGEARERTSDRGFAADLVQGDAARLPLRDDAVDLAVYVATLHHLPSAEVRRRSLDELGRVLAPGGRALVSAWSTEHDRFEQSEARSASDSRTERGASEASASEVRAGRTDPRAAEGRETSEGFDTILDWTLPDGTTVPRFYHVYAPGEFRETLEAAALRVLDFEVSSGNCYATVAPVETRGSRSASES